MARLQHKVSGSLKQALEKLKLSENVAETKGENRNLSSPFRVFVIDYYHPLLVTVDMKVMLTVEVNG